MLLSSDGLAKRTDKKPRPFQLFFIFVKGFNIQGVD